MENINETEKYNGWVNRETWLINLHLTNTEYIYNEVRNLLKQKYEYEFQKEEALKDYVEELIQIDSNNDTDLLRSDLLSTSLSRVNWGDIVKAFEEE